MFVFQKHLSGFSKSGKRGTAQGILASLDGEDEGINVSFSFDSNCLSSVIVVYINITNFFLES